MKSSDSNFLKKYNFVLKVEDKFQIKRNEESSYIAIAGKISKGQITETPLVRILNKGGKVQKETTVIEARGGFTSKWTPPHVYYEGDNLAIVFECEIEKYLEIGGYIVI